MGSGWGRERASFAIWVARKLHRSPSDTCVGMQEEFEEDDQEQEALEALFSLAGGVPDFAAGDHGPAPRVKIEEPSKPVRAMGHNSSVRPAEGKNQRERRQRSSPRDDDDRDWAPSKEPSAARASITAPKAVKANNSSTPAGPVSMQVPPASNVGLGTGLGAFAGPFPGGVNGSFFDPAGPQATAPQATAASQGGVWPPPAPFLGEAFGTAYQLLMHAVFQNSLLHVIWGWPGTGSFQTHTVLLCCSKMDSTMVLACSTVLQACCS